MPKLYYTPTSCGAASFISMVAAGLELDVEQVHLDCHKTATDADFFTINPKGNVPCLVFDDGTILNENVSVLQYIADMVRFSCTENSFPPSDEFAFATHHRTPTAWLLRTALWTDTYW